METAALRMLDANANRAREALRVLEDYARFALDEQAIALRLKRIRHRLAVVLDARLPDALIHRDAAGDVGKDNKTPTEFSRTALADIVTAAGKRLGEALRVLEEVLKIDSPAAAGEIERLRYDAYDVEQLIGMRLRPAGRFGQVRLYVLITEALCRNPWLETARAAIAGGADCLQLREKTMESGELLSRARALVRVCREANVLSIINDRPDIALLAGADGVHVGQDDLPVAQVRKIVGATPIVGVSTHRIEQLEQAARNGADYVGVGPVFRSQTKPRQFLPGLPYARQVAELGGLPAVAIAGITASNVDEVTETGINAVAVSSAVIGAADVQAAAQAIKSRLVK